MTLPRVSPFKYSGPFLGLNTTRAPRELGPMWATDAKNVLLTDGRIRPRPPLRLVENLRRFIANHEIVGLYQWDSPKVGQQILIKSVDQSKGRFWALSKTGFVDFTPFPLSTFAPTWVNMHGLVYMVDGSYPLIKTDGTGEGTIMVGIVPPTNVTITEENAGPEDAVLEGDTVYQYAITYYDADHDVESNPFYSLHIRTFTEHPRMLIVLYEPEVVHSGRTHFRVYRKNVTLEQTFFLLMAQVDIWEGLYRDPQGTLQHPTPPLGTTTTGPFAPCRNGIPQRATVACYYKDRMFYNDIDNPDLLRFSAFGHPDHVDPADYKLLAGDAQSGVTGLAELSGQLVILRPRNIWALSGEIETATNETLATGAMPNTSYEELWRTKSNVGCANRHGPNGAIVAGRPAQLYFPSPSGFYSFDGLVERQVSDQIQPTWKDFTRRPSSLPPGVRYELDQMVTHAVDPQREIIYLVQTAQHSGEPQILCYHYGLNRGDGVGGWTYITMDNPEECAVCVASPMGYTEYAGELLLYSGLMVATSAPPAVGPHIYVLNSEGYLDPEGVAPCPMPAFRYQTGRMVLIDGAEKHIYLIKWLHDQVDVGSPIMYLARLRFGFAARGETDFAKVAADLSKGIYFRQPVRREVSDITLLIEDTGESNVYWHEDFAVTGWALEAELAGHG